MNQALILPAAAALLVCLGSGADAADPVARDVGPAAGLLPHGLTNVSTQGETPVFDYDGDGLLDMVLSTHGGSTWPLMRNNGDGTFSEVVNFSKTDRHGCAAADLGSPGGDGRPDGLPDVYCVTGACKGTCTKNYPNHLFLQQADGGVQRHVERAQVAVVDADERRLQPQRAIEFGAVVHLHEHVHAERERAGFQVGHPRVVQAGGDEQDAVGAERARLDDLVLVDHEVLAQRRQRAGGARLLQVGGRALEEAFVGQHAEAGSAVGRVAGGDLGRHEPLPKHALAGAGLLHLGDDGGVAGGHLCAQRRREAAHVAPRLRLFAPARQAALGTACGDLVALDGDDAFENVRRHVAQDGRNLFVTLTNWLSLAIALPEATASRARFTPSVMLGTTSAQ